MKDASKSRCVYPHPGRAFAGKDGFRRKSVRKEASNCANCALRQPGQAGSAILALWQNLRQWQKALLQGP